MRTLPPFFASVGLLSLACSADMCRGITSAVVGTTVETTKEVTTGVAEGFEEGRKAGQSVDGAAVVSTIAELEAHGALSIYGVKAAEGGSDVIVAVENTSDAPLRVSGLQVVVLDDEGFVKRPTEGGNASVTVPARAKDQVHVRFDVAPEKVRTVRVWDKDLPVPAP